MTPVNRPFARCFALSLVGAVLTAGACRNVPSEAAAPLSGDSMPVAIGQEVRQSGNDVFRVTLMSVEADSRCPTGVQCVWQGDATVVLGYRFGMGPTVPVKLNLNTPPRDTLIGTVRIVFDSLTPYPAQPGPMPAQDKYRAWLTLR